MGQSLYTFVQPGFQTGVGNNINYWTQLIKTDEFDT